MIQFEDLPLEVISEIVKFATPVNVSGERVGKEDLCKLRLVSRQLNHIASAILFAEVRLEFEDTSSREPTAPDTRRCLEIIHALVMGSTRVFEHTIRLSLSPQELYWTSEEQRKGVSEAQNFVLKKIFDAVSALKNLRTITYRPNPEHDPQELAVSVIRALGNLPFFEGFTELALLGDPPPSFTLQLISGLTTLHVSWRWNRPKHLIAELASLLARCPDLQDVSFGGTKTDVTFSELFADVGAMEFPLRLRKLSLCGVQVTLDDIITHIQHLERLVSLGITSNSAKDADAIFGQICTILSDNNIYLKGITTDFSTDPLVLSYLTSYSGLDQLSLSTTEGTQTEDLAGAVDAIYNQILPKHAATLRVFQLDSTEEIPTVQQFEELLKCRELSSLEISVNAMQSDLSSVDVTPLETWLNVCLRLPKLEHLQFIPRLSKGPMITRSFIVWSIVRRETVQKYREEYQMKFRANRD